MMTIFVQVGFWVPYTIYYFFPSERHVWLYVCKRYTQIKTKYTYKQSYTYLGYQDNFYCQNVQSCFPPGYFRIKRIEII